MSKWRTDEKLLAMKKAAQIYHVRKYVEEEKTIRITATIAGIQLEDGRVITGEALVGRNAQGVRMIGREIAAGRATKNTAIVLEKLYGRDFQNGKIFANLEQFEAYVKSLGSVPRPRALKA